MVKELKPTVVKRDKSPVADLKQPWKNRLRQDRQVTGTIELAYLRGYQAGYEDGLKAKRPKRKSVKVKR